jgi:glycine/D-amino acid oxidase-like deaminating enzyme
MQFVVIGGGIAGVTCAEELARLSPDDHVLLISASESLKGVRFVPRS